MQEHKNKYDILDSLFDGVLVIGKDYSTLFANKVLRDICGVKIEEVKGKKCHEISHRCPLPCGSEKERGVKDSGSFICPHKVVFSTARPVNVSHVHYCFDGEERIFSITASPVMDEKGEVREMVEILRDVTEKERLRKKLEEQESFLESILEGIGDGVVVIDRDFKIISANKGYCSQVKISCDEIIGKHCYEVSHHLSKPCYENGEECSVKEAFETGQSHRIIHTHFDKENKPIYIETVSYPLKNESGNIVSAIEVLTDITGRFGLEKNLKEKVKELEEFYDMAVGRELRMVELKEEIERLREELKKHERR